MPSEGYRSDAIAVCGVEIPAHMAEDLFAAYRLQQLREENARTRAMITILSRQAEDQMGFFQKIAAIARTPEYDALVAALKGET